MMNLLPSRKQGDMKQFDVRKIERMRIRAKLDLIDELYPPERLQKSKERWAAIWRGDKPNDRYPFLTGYPFFNPYDAPHTPKERLEASLDACISMARVTDDFIPSIFPGACNQATIPGMFGAEPVQVGLETTCERPIHDPSDIDNLPEPSLVPGTPAHDWLMTEQYLLEVTEGRIPIHVCDMQGPVDVCGQLWGYDNLFLCAYDDPERYDKLMTKVSDAFILLWQEQKKLLGPAFVGTHLFAWDWVPAGVGATLSADSMVMVSSEFFKEFFAPYLARISAALGGLAVHSCGNYSAVVAELCQVSGLRAVNASQMSIPQILDAGFDTSKIIIAATGKDSASEIFSLAKKTGFGPDFSFMDMWPTKDGINIPVQNWSSDEEYNFDKTNKLLLEAASLS
jgi:hypothetical protein